MYQVYIATRGNKPLLFGGGSPDMGNSEDLSGVEFINGTRPGNPGLVDLAKRQVGNVGGYPYWSWYGFNSRVEWCACFVSWCYNQAGKSEPRRKGGNLGVHKLHMEDVVFIGDFLAGRFPGFRVGAGFGAVADFHLLGQRQDILEVKDPL